MITTSTFSNDFLNEKRNRGDSSMDDFITLMFKNPSEKINFYPYLETLSTNKDLDNAHHDLTFQNLLSTATKLPDWANPKQMKLGSAFFSSHAEAIMNMLGLLSLPYCYTAAKGSMVLYLSGRLRNDAGKRLSETAEFVWEVMAPDAFDSLGKGFVSVFKVRLMHAAARYYTLKSGNWKSAEWDTPINQEDMAGTNLSFSLLVIRGLTKLGYQLKLEDKLSFLHLWNVIGYLSGIDEDLITQDIKQAQVLEASIKNRQFMISDHGRALTQTLINHIEELNNGKVPQKDVLALMRYLLGNDVADQLGIKKSELSNNKLALLQLSNSFKNLFTKDNIVGNYNTAYRSFKKQIT